MNWGDVIIYLGSIAAAITTIAAILFWLYKKLVLEPDDRMMRKAQEKSNKELRETIKPLSRATETLNYNLEESARDRKDLRERVESHDIVLSDHETQIAILQEWRKHHKQFGDKK